MSPHVRFGLQIGWEFKLKARILVPTLHDVKGHLGKASIERIERPAARIELSLSPFEFGRSRGVLGVSNDGRRYLFVPKRTQARPDVDEILVASEAIDTNSLASASEGIRPERIHPKPVNPAKQRAEAERIATQVPGGWVGGVRLTRERSVAGKVDRAGLRSPQIGALHALLAHWTVTSRVATVVMPTGTGKTETMIAAAVEEAAQKVLIVVPTDALRSQIATSFARLGVLPQLNLVDAHAPLPCVGVLRGAPRTVEETDCVFGCTNVVVATMSALSKAPDDVLERMAKHTTHLFVDEAHHVAAKTWRAFRSRFERSRIVQFTATPFRNDGLRVDGRFVFSYPLRLAQAEGYFRPIEFVPVRGFDQEKIDERIVARVVETLRRDDSLGHQHVAMARCRNRARAEAVHALYVKTASHLRPTLLHSGLSNVERKAALTSLRDGVARVVVCVDMLGEGFDLPALKIAGLHDPKKTEGPTLQFVGRFTRTGENLGSATVIAGTQGDDGSVLSSLYAEDADWNRLVRDIGTRRTKRAIRREEVFQGFDDHVARFPLETMKPRMSAVAYKTGDGPWDPDRLLDFDRDGLIVDGPFVNPSASILVFVTRNTERPKWTRARMEVDVRYDLVMAYWNQETNLLYVHSSSGDRIDELAQALCGADATRVRGETMFRAMSGLNRPVLNVLGLSETRRRRIRHTQLQGTDIAAEVKTSPGNRSRTRTNLFVVGFGLEGRETVGCSQKGKIWSYESTDDFGAWMDWCDSIGRKLTDETLSTDEIMGSFIAPKLIEELPKGCVPVAVLFADEILGAVEEKWVFLVDGIRTSLLEVGLRLDAHDLEDGVVLEIAIRDQKARWRMTIVPGRPVFEKIDGPTVSVERAGGEMPLGDWFAQYPPTIYFANGDSMIGDEIFELPADGVPADFDRSRIVPWEWDGIDIRKESQTEAKLPGTVQGEVIRRVLLDPANEVIYDDDGAGEAADLVVVRRDGDRIVVVLYHCKYSGAGKSGNRISDLYEVCGQAQQSIRWCEHPRRLFEHLLRREDRKIFRGAASGFERGDVSTLRDMLVHLPETFVNFEIVAVQPGYSKNGAKEQHMQVLSSTAALLMDTFQAPFTLISSP